MTLTQPIRTILDNAIYSLGDLRLIEDLSQTFVLLGHPVSHSLSPQLHNTVFNYLYQSGKLSQRYFYIKVDVGPADLAEVIALLKAKKCPGVNITLPHKAEAGKMLSSLSQDARLSGAVNTLVLDKGDYVGHNTDIIGLSQGLHSSLDFSSKGKRVLILGSGGAARAASYSLLEQGASHITVAGRSKSELTDLIYGDIDGSTLDDIDLIINATPLGLNEGDAMPPISLSELNPNKVCIYDMAYSQKQTVWVRKAQSLGLHAADGLSMLVHQGLASQGLWLGIDTRGHYNLALSNLIQR